MLTLHTLTWDSTNCGLKYYPPITDLKDSMGNLQVKDEGEAVLERQAVEDLNAFGRRPAPIDAKELGPNSGFEGQTAIGDVELPDTSGAGLNSENLKRL